MISRYCGEKHRRAAIFSSRRRGASWLGVSVILTVIAAAVLGVGWYVASSNALSSARENLLVHAVDRRPFTHTITVKGEVESSSNVDVRCLVKSQNSAGTAILWIVEEGTYVQPGDKLVELDSSALESERTGQQIVVNTSKAMVIQSRNVYETAKIAKIEYEKGTFTQEKQTINGEIFTAEEDLRRAEQYLIYSNQLFEKDFYTELQLKADEFAVEQAKNALELAQNKLFVLENYTKDKMLKQLEADIQTADAKLDSDDKSHRLDLQRLEEVEEQIAHCNLYAETAGQVVYANEDSYRGNDIIIEEGTLVRERQVLIRLPDPVKMQVKSKVNEAHIKLVKEGMTATIRVDAFPESTLTGTVTRVSEMPESGGWRRGNVREYATLVKIDNPPPGLRPGMNSEVKILVEQSANELQVPVQALVEHGGKYYCLLQDGAGFEAREVLTGSSNEKFMVVRDGLKTSEKVLMSPRTYLGEANLPAVPQQQTVADRGRPNQPRTPASGGVATARGASGPAGDQPPGRQPTESAGGEPTDVAVTMIERMDGDADGKLSSAEVPDRMRDSFQENDANSDGFLDARELSALLGKTSTAGVGGGGAGQ